MNITKTKNLKLFVLLVAVAVLAIGYSLASSLDSQKEYKLYLNGKALNQNWVDEMVGDVYVSAVTLKEFGYDVKTNEWSTSSTITKGNDVVKLSTASYMADKNDQKVSLHTKKINGVHVPSGAKAFALNNEFMIPVESLNQLFNISTTVKEDGNVVSVHLGKVVEPKPEKPEKPSDSGIKEDPKYPFPEGYVPGKITGVWTDDKAANLQTIAEGLGSDLAKYQSKSGATVFNVHGKFHDLEGEILIFSHDVNNMIPYDADIMVKAWDASHNELNNTIPYAMREILRFYLGESDGDWAFDVVEKSFSGGAPELTMKQLKVGNRYIEFKPNQILIGKPNEKYDESWMPISK